MYSVRFASLLLLKCSVSRYSWFFVKYQQLCGEWFLHCSIGYSRKIV